MMFKNQVYSRISVEFVFYLNIGLCDFGFLGCADF